MAKACRQALQAARSANARVTTAEALQILREQGIAPLPSESTIKREFARVDDRREYAAKKRRAEHEVVELPLAGGELLAAAEVSKATVYNHFADKRALFCAAFLDLTAVLRSRIAEVFESQTGDAAQELQRVGEHFLAVVLDTTSIALHRVLVAEVARFPELGKALYEHGACTMKLWVATYLQRQHAGGALRVDDPELAAKQFLALCQVDLVTQCQLGITPATSQDAVRASVANAVHTFLRAHRP